MHCLSRIHARPGRTFALASLLCILGAIWSPPVLARDIVFPDPPRLATTAASLRALREAPERADERAAILKRAAPYLDDPPFVPDKPGNWTFYYANPKTGGRLVALSPSEHRDPATGEIFADERIVGAYRTRLHDRANNAALDLAWAYAITGNERYARPVRDILVKLAKAMPTFPARHDRWGNSGVLAPWGGRRYSQSLDEAYGVIRLAKAYDLTRSARSYSEADHRQIQEEFFRATAETLLFSNKGISNHQTWYNAGLMCIASVLGDAAMVNRTLDMKGGYYDQLARSVGDDGLWYEGTMAYHRYAFQAMREIIQAARPLGLALHEEPRFRSMILAPLDATYSNGQFPAVNDSDRILISGYKSIFQWAAELYDDERLRHAAVDPLAAIASTSRVLDPTGLAFMQVDQGPSAVCAVVDFGPHGGGHGHFDKLNLMLYGLGRELLLDPGRLSYSHPAHRTWTKHTAAHNTVTIDQQSQRASQGELVQFDTGPDAVACTVQSTGAYPGLLLRRHLYLQGRLLVDVFTVEAPDARQIDWFAHVDAEAVAHERGKGAPLELPRDHGYNHFESPVAYPLAGRHAWDFVLPAKDAASAAPRLRMWTIAAGEEAIVLTRGIGHTPASRPPCLIRRRFASRTAFITLYDLSGDGSLVTAVDAHADGSAIAVTRPNGILRLTVTKMGIYDADASR